MIELMKYLEINFGCLYSFLINIVEVYVFFVDKSECKMYLILSWLLFIYLDFNVFIGWVLYIVILLVC